ncbi:MAG: PDZ domain-containing protein [bacterium]|nr:PDZ domain-containing protein [bacterium]
MKRQLCIAMLCAIAGGAGGQDLPDLQPFPADLPCRFGVVGVRAHAVHDTLRVDKVRLYSPAARAGLRVGDRILGGAGVRLTDANQLSLLVQSLAPGDTIHFHVLRGDESLDLACQVTDRKGLYGLMTESGRLQVPLAERHLDWEQSIGPEEARALRLIRQQQAQGAADTLKQALALELTRYGVDGRLADVEFVLRHPLKAPAAARALGQTFAPDLGLTEYLLGAASHLDLQLPSVPPPATEDPVPSAALARLLLGPLQAAAAEVEAAFAGLSATLRTELRQGIGSLLQRFDRSFYLDEGDSTETEAHMQTLRLAKRVDVSRLVQAALHLSPLTEPQTLRRIRAATSDLKPAAEPLPPGFEGRFLYAEHTPWGWFIVGDKSANVYAGPAAMIVDLGGDDTYLTGSTPDDDTPVMVVIDLGGDDRYVGNHIGSLGGAVMGVSLLVDRSGDDTYAGDVLTQGAAFCGVGILWDSEGDDTYLAQHSAQGAAFFGAGLLIDGSGDDFLSLGQYGQGFGGAQGLGLLLDHAGHDRYVADLKVPSGYGTAGVYSGWSQGIGVGFRGFAPGGLGLLLSSGDGDDIYQAGDFSQGTGYFLGLGILADAGGDDRYLGARYAQGSAAHQAAGVLLDERGNDHYVSSLAATQGAAWDASVAVLIDGSGDDSYVGGDLCQGAAAMNGIGWLADAAGNDTYQARTGQAEGGSTQYWGGRSALNLGLLLDGQGKDTYSRADRKDNAAMRDSRVGLFADD